MNMTETRSSRPIISLDRQPIPRTHAEHWDSVTKTVLKLRGPRPVYQIPITEMLSAAEDAKPLDQRLVRLFDVLRPIGAGAAVTAAIAACTPPAIVETVSPSPSEQASPSPTESPSPTPTPTVEITPSPTPTPTPEATPNIETVPLVEGGNIGKDVFSLRVRNGTVVAIERNPDGTVKDFAITIPGGNRISRTCDKLFTDECSYKGEITFWINVTDRTYLVSLTQNKRIGKGSVAVSNYIVLGKDIPLIVMATKTYLSEDYNVDVPGNLASLQKLDKSVGKKSLPRSDRSFIFNVVGINIY